MQAPKPPGGEVDKDDLRITRWNPDDIPAFTPTLIKTIEQS
jgi:hypothetical protein